MNEYAEKAAESAELNQRDVKAASRAFRDACLRAAATQDTKTTIYESVRFEMLRHGLTEDGAKSNASKFAKVSIWVRGGGQWPRDRGLSHVYGLARRPVTKGAESITCPNCSHEWMR